MSLLNKIDIENENPSGCFPNNKQIKCFMRRRSRAALKPFNGQRNKTKVEKKEEVMKENKV